MFLDANLVVSGSLVGATVTGQTVTGTNTSVLSTNTIDLGAKRDLGEGEDLRLRALVTTAFAGLTSLDIQVVVADDAALSSNLTVVGSTGAIPLASLGAGARYVAEINPRVGGVGQRYLGVRYVIVGAGSAGAVLAEFGADLEDGGKTYPVGYSIT